MNNLGRYGNKRVVSVESANLDNLESAEEKEEKEKAVGAMQPFADWMKVPFRHHSSSPSTPPPYSHLVLTLLRNNTARG